MINGYFCRIWYKGQPLICNLCGVQGHKSAACPNKDKCRRCGETGHFARACTKAWPTNRDPSTAGPSMAADAVLPTPGLSGVASSGADPPATSSEDSLAAVDSHPTASEPGSVTRPSHDVGMVASDLSLTDGQHVPDDIEPTGLVVPMDSAEQPSNNSDEVESVVSSEGGAVRSVESESGPSGTKRVLSDPEGDPESSQSILVDAQDAQHVVKKIRRLFTRKGSIGRVSKLAGKPGRHTMPALAPSRPRSNST